MVSGLCGRISSRIREAGVPDAQEQISPGMAVAVIMIVRLDKFLADMGYGTRSQVKKELV